MPRVAIPDNRRLNNMERIVLQKIAKRHNLSATGKAANIRRRLIAKRNRDDKKPKASLHERQVEILRLLKKAGGYMSRPELTKKTTFGQCPGGAPGCGSPLGRYIGFPGGTSNISIYPKSLLNRGLVKMSYEVNPEGTTAAQILMISLTKKGVQALKETNGRA